jgi:hypothetical protein
MRVNVGMAGSLVSADSLGIQNKEGKTGETQICASGENLPVWHDVSLKKPTALASLRVRPYFGDGQIHQYKVEGSEDGSMGKCLPT